jgi:DNA-binding response OmpR family regulator
MSTDAPRILVADDEPLIAMIIDDWLVEMKFATLGPVGTVREALALIETSPPDAAILDIRLADGSSYDVADRLRARNIPFAFASGQDASDMDPRFKDVAVLTKPFDFDQFRKVLAAMVRGHTV